MSQIAKEEKIVFMCTADDMHPYNCDTAFGGTCIHCERSHEGSESCALCNFDIHSEADDEAEELAEKISKSVKAKQ